MDDRLLELLKLGDFSVSKKIKENLKRSYSKEDLESVNSIFSELVENKKLEIEILETNKRKLEYQISNLEQTRKNIRQQQCAILDDIFANNYITLPFTKQEASYYSGIDHVRDCIKIPNLICFKYYPHERIQFLLHKEKTPQDNKLTFKILRFEISMVILELEDFSQPFGYNNFEEFFKLLGEQK